MWEGGIRRSIGDKQVNINQAYRVFVFYKELNNNTSYNDLLELINGTCFVPQNISEERFAAMLRYLLIHGDVL